MHLLCAVVLAVLGAGQTNAGVTQNPRHKITRTGENMTLQCTQNMDHNAMYWYRQDPGLGLRLIHYSAGVGDARNGDIPEGYSVSRSKEEHFHLTLGSASPSQTAVYFCASSLSTGDRHAQTFGGGTRLTVLDDLSKVTPPKVAVFEPSEAEISRTQKATLVCLATNFYPDHVELSWWVNGKEARSGVSTDPQPQKGCTGVSDSTYCMSSLLRVSAAFWHNPRNHFRCQVQFYGLSAEDEDQWDEENNGPLPVTQNISAEAWGHADCGLTSVSYQQGVLSATVLYEVLLGKAALYAVLVSALVLVAMVKKKDS